MQSGSNNNNTGHHSNNSNNNFYPTTNQQQYIFQQQQLLPYSNNASNSAHSSPLRRSVAQQAVSPLASPMESRRVFMATHHQNNSSGGGGGGSPPPTQGQILGTASHPATAVGLSAVQLGYAIPACRLLIDPHTGQQFFVPTVTAPQPLATAAAPAFFQPIYTQQTAYFQQPPLANFSSNNSSNSRQRQHNNQVLLSPSSSPPNQHHQRHLPATAVSQPQGPFLYNIGHPQQQLTSSSGFYTSTQQQQQQLQRSPSSSNHHHSHHYVTSGGGPHRSQSPLGTSPRDDRLEDSSTAGLPYKVEMPPSTVGSIAYNDERRRPSNDTYKGYDVETEEEQICQRGNYYNDRNFHQQQQQFQRREQARLSTESRQSNSTRDSGRGGLVFGSPDNNNNSDIEEPSPRYYSSYSPPPAHQYKHQHPHHYNQNNQMSTSTIIGGGGGSSDSTSGFASMIGGCENKNYSNRGGGGTFLLEDSFHHSPQKQQHGGVFGSNNKASFASSPPFRVKTTTDLPSHHQQQQQQLSSQTRMKAIRMDIDLSSSGLGSGGSTPMEGNGGGLTRNGRPSSFGNVFASGGGGKGGGTDKITATTTATTMAGDELSVRGATVLRTAPPTAFTISFNDEHAQLGGQVSIAEVSLQEAARQAPKGRRLMLSRKNENVNNKQKQQQLQDSGSECGGDPKRWLFRKMMMGRKGEASKSSDRRRRRSGSAISEATTSTTMSGGGGGHETTTEEGQEDLASEAGTYVVENKIKTGGTTNDVMTTSQISGVSNTSSNRTTQRCYDSDSDSSSSTHASTHTSSTGRTPSPGNPPISATTTTTNIRPPLTISGQVGKRSLMSDLRQLRESGQIEKPSIINQQSASNVKISNKKIPPKTLGVVPTSTKLASTAPPIPPHRGNSAGVATTITTNSNQNQKKNTTVFASNPIPFSRPCRCPTQHQQQQQQQQQAFREAFTSNRSISATLTNQEQQNSKQQSSFSRWKAAQQKQQQLIDKQPPLESHRSHDELNRLAEVCDDEDDSIGLISDSCNTSLQRTVDELTQKCHKSIALLKLCNQSSLSPSVEHLLERVAQTGVLTEEGSKERGGDVSCVGGKSGVVTSSNENISDRLEQLSSAFDAIQKYLEEQTTTTTTFSGQQKSQQQSPQRTFSGTFVVKKSRSGGVSLDVADEDTLKYQTKEKKK
ncbi:unnamed protein product [Meloidogyne enterolobii]|uniref:Uncharacterized protein n=1 Tax=Meloidogyne enterolobii TaxID=390850 RepID=A0ACB0XZY1_MELEN